MLSNLNGSLSELHELLITNYGEDYALSESFVSTAAGEDSIPLPADFFKLLSLDISTCDGYATVSRFNLSARNRYLPQSALPASVFRLWYVPRFSNLTSLSDELPDNLTLENWSEYAIVDTCIKVATKREDDPSVFMAQKAGLAQRIGRHSKSRDAGQPFTAIQPEGFYEPLYLRSSPVSYRLHGNVIKLILSRDFS